MALDPDFLTMCSTTVDHTPATTERTPYGAVQFSTATETYPAHVEWGNRLVLNSLGREEVSKATVFVMSSSAVFGLQDRVTLPNDTAARLIAVWPMHDEEGLHHTELGFA